MRARSQPRRSGRRVPVPRGRSSSGTGAARSRPRRRDRAEHRAASVAVIASWTVADPESGPGRRCTPRRARCSTSPAVSRWNSQARVVRTGRPELLAPRRRRPPARGGRRRGQDRVVSGSPSSSRSRRPPSAGSRYVTHTAPCSRACTASALQPGSRDAAVRAERVCSAGRRGLRVSSRCVDVTLVDGRWSGSSPGQHAGPLPQDRRTSPERRWRAPRRRVPR